jgi:hypothetical protein
LGAVANGEMTPGNVSGSNLDKKGYIHVAQPELRNIASGLEGAAIGSIRR